MDTLNLTPTDNRVLDTRKITAHGDWIAQRTAHALTARLNHRNQDGSWYSPRIVASVVNPPFHLIVLDDNALFHFPRHMLVGQPMLDAIGSAVQRQVFGFLPEELSSLLAALQRDGVTLPYGVTYTIPLVPLRMLMPAHAPAQAALPRRASLNLDRIPAGKLLVPIGVSAHGPLWVPLPRVQHSLVVGATGSGKTTWMRGVLAALLTANTPAELQIAIFDPKGCEFNALDTERTGDGAYLFDRVAYEPAPALALLERIVVEMERRNQLFAAKNVRDIAGYNRGAHPPLPYLLVVLDEVNSLVGECVEKKLRVALGETLKTLTRMARNTGVFLMAATQYISAREGLPRMVEANCQARFVFKVVSAEEAQRAQCPGAETITTWGRMLYREMSGVGPHPVQGFVITDDQFLAVAHALAERLAGAPGKAPKAPRLLDDERALALYARDHLGGKFKIAALAEAFRGRISQRRIEEISRAWEVRHWLIAGVTRAESKHLSDETLALLTDMPATNKPPASESEPRRIIAFPAARVGAPAS